MKRQIDCMDGGVTALDIESMARYWSQDAENYGNIIQDELASFRVEAWQKLLREKMPADTSRVLDFGCGPAFFSIILAKMGLEVTAVDCSEGMLAQARQLIETTGVSVDLQQMDINQLDFATGSFDVIVSRNVTWTLSNPWQVLQNANDCCDQGNAYCCLMPIGICPCMMRIWPGGQKTGGRNVCVSMAMLWRLLMRLLSPSTHCSCP